jgi:hypothetical protein
VTRALAILALLAVLAGCASSVPQQQYPRSGSTPRVRCLSDPNESQTRPLFFLFCAESP